MKKALSLVSAAALAVAMVAPASAENLPLNTVSGGQGEEKVQGQALAGGALAAGAGFVAAVAVVAIVAATAGDDSTVSTTP